MSRLMIQSTSIVPPMPSSASVQPNVQVSITSWSIGVVECWADFNPLLLHSGTPFPPLFDHRQFFFGLDRLPRRDLDLLDHAAGRRDHRDLHLHCLQYDDDVVF